MNIKKVLKSGGVMRYHATPEIPCQSNAEHQWGVAVLLQQFYPDMGRHVQFHALTHDSAEMMTGDTPSYAKQKEPVLKMLLDKMEDEVSLEWGITCQLTKEEIVAVKYCDVLEGLTYCYNQVRMGNKAALPIFLNWVNYYQSLDNGYKQKHHQYVLEKVEELGND